MGQDALPLTMARPQWHGRRLFVQRSYIPPRLALENPKAYKQRGFNYNYVGHDNQLSSMQHPLFGRRRRHWPGRPHGRLFAMRQSMAPCAGGGASAANDTAPAHVAAPTPGGAAPDGATRRFPAPAHTAATTATGSNSATTGSNSAATGSNSAAARARA